MTRNYDSTLDFVEALSKMYVAEPGRVLPNALWKTRAIVERCETRFYVSGDAKAVTHTSG